MKKGILRSAVISNEAIADGVYKMVISCPQAVDQARPGQFINIYPAGESTLLPRPISICNVETEKGQLSVVYGIVGRGTQEFSTYEPGILIKHSTPLGSGYEYGADARAEEITGQGALLVGGGIGVPPLLYLAKELKKEGRVITTVVGFREEPFLIEELAAVCDCVYVAVEEGAEIPFLPQGVAWLKGTVLDIIRREQLDGTCSFACGPKPMLAALCQWAEGHGYDIQISMEERMGCGYGACLGCICDLKSHDGQGIVRKRVCKDGPVFRGREVAW